MDKAFVNLLSSDRVIKDVDDLMNSLFWIEALKTQNAKGISDTLNCNFYDELINEHFLLILSRPVS